MSQLRLLSILNSLVVFRVKTVCIPLIEPNIETGNDASLYVWGNENLMFVLSSAHILRLE